MAWTSGTATDYRDLLRKLRQFVTTDMTPASERWQELRWSETSSTQELILKGPGLAGVDEIYVGIRSFEDATAGWYWWDLQGLTGYVSGNPFNAQPGAISDYPCGMSLHQYAIPYWFFANGRRIIVVAKVGTYYEQAYLGFMLPYATPSEHFYPMFVGGSQTANGGRLRSRTDDGHRAYWHPKLYNNNQSYLTYSASLIWMAGAWQRVANSSGDGAQSYPYCITGTIDYGTTLAGDYVLMPVELVRFSSSTAESRHCFGVLDGVYWISGMNNAAENVVTVGGDQYFVVQNIYRTAYDEFAAIKMV